MDLVESSSPSNPRPRGVADVGREAAGVAVWLRGGHDSSTVAEVSAVLDGAAGLAADGLVIDLGG
jgi:hypothetical protein